MPSFDAPDFQAAALARRDEFTSAEPFPHLVLEDFLPAATADALAAEFASSALRWKSYHHVNERKRVCSDVTTMGPVARAVVAALQAPPFLRTLEALAGVPDLVADPELDGSGLQETVPGGFLNVHADHLAHATRRTWSRQLNLLLFLNPDWPDAYRGWLELWDCSVTRCVRRIAPSFNRCVVFRTTPSSFHGVPEGVECPPDRVRRSLALYYFHDERALCPLRPTRYVPRPTDPPIRRALIHADRWLLHGYSALKRYTPIGDALVSRVLRYF